MKVDQRLCSSHHWTLGHYHVQQVSFFSFNFLFLSLSLFFWPFHIFLIFSFNWDPNYLLIKV
ncbi:hypothetical protein WN943_005999 [Citrus x changshan-huyou]